MIFTVTINPAIDKVLFLDEFLRSKTNRLNKVMEMIGGKGTHVSINLNIQGVKNTALGIVFGDNGEKIIKHLHAIGVEEKFLEYQIQGMESRINYEIVEENDHTCTMLNEKGPKLPKQVTDDLIQQIHDLVKDGDSLILTGDASNVEDTTIYSRITQDAKRRGVKVFLDASGDYLLQGLESCPFLIKPNIEELSFLANKELNSLTEIIAAIRELDRFNIPIIAMTWGRNGAVIKSMDELFFVHPIEVNAVNEAGCGDAFLSALVAGIQEGSPMIDTLMHASAISAATVESELTVGFEPDRVKELIKKAQVEKIF